jgi:hypothetical protein
MASKAASKDDVDKLIEAASGKFVSSNGDWYSKLSTLGKSIADKVGDRNPSGPSAIAIMQEVMETACPADVQLIPSEGTMRRWLRKRRKKNP